MDQCVVREGRAGREGNVLVLLCECEDLSLDSQHSHKKPGAGGHVGWTEAHNSQKLWEELGPEGKFLGGQA